MTATLRGARPDDIPAIQRVRQSVRENRLVSGRGLARLWLSTDPGTRAEGFYRAAGWRDAGPAPHGEIRFEIDRPDAEERPPQRPL